MNQIDFKLSSTMNRPLELAGWHLTRRGVSRGAVLISLVGLSWAALWMAAHLLF